MTEVVWKELYIKPNVVNDVPELKHIYTQEVVREIYLQLCDLMASEELYLLCGDNGESFNKEDAIGIVTNLNVDNDYNISVEIQPIKGFTSAEEISKIHVNMNIRVGEDNVMWLKDLRVLYVSCDIVK